MGLTWALAQASQRPVGETRRLLADLPVAAPDPATAPGRLELPADLGDLGPAHRSYLQGRGFDPNELAETWGVKGIGPLGGPLAWRVWLPLRDASGRTVSWTTRAIGRDVPHGARYRGARAEQSAVPRAECLGGVEHVRSACVVCEGFFNAAWVGPGGVWTGGVGFSKGQVLEISRVPVRAILFDNEPAAQRRAQALARSLEAFPGDTFVITTSGPDPAESPRAEAEEIRRQFLE